MIVPLCCWCSHHGFNFKLRFFYSYNNFVVYFNFLMILFLLCEIPLVMAHRGVISYSSLCIPEALQVEVRR